MVFGPWIDFLWCKCRKNQRNRSGASVDAGAGVWCVILDELIGFIIISIINAF